MSTHKQQTTPRSNSQPPPALILSSTTTNTKPCYHAASSKQPSTPHSRGPRRYADSPPRPDKPRWCWWDAAHPIVAWAGITPCRCWRGGETSDFDIIMIYCCCCFCCCCCQLRLVIWYFRSESDRFLTKDSIENICNKEMDHLNRLFDE